MQTEVYSKVLARGVWLRFSYSMTATLIAVELFSVQEQVPLWFVRKQRSKKSS